jgi:hypothetical protein
MPEKKHTQAARQLKNIEKYPTGIRGLELIPKRCQRWIHE